MQRLFGVDMGLIGTGLAAAVAAVAGLLALLAVRRPVMLKLGLRPIPRRKAQTGLIVLGLMLATLIITAAFVAGDTMAHVVRSFAIQDLGEMDEWVRLAPGAQPAGAVGEYFKADRFERLRAELAGYAGVDAVAPVVRTFVPAINLTRRQSARSVEVLGLSADGLALLPAGERADAAGAPLELEALLPNQVALNAAAARALDAQPGDELRLYLDEAGRRLVVGRVTAGGAQPRLLLPLRRAQALFNQRGRLNFIYISNAGQGLASAEASPAVTTHLRGLLTEPQAAADLFALLAQDSRTATVLRAEAAAHTGQYSADLAAFARLLEAGNLTPEARSFLADPGYGWRLYQLLERDGWRGARTLQRLNWLLAHQAVLQVDDVKWDLLDEGEQMASAFTLIFMATGLFSLAAGLLLIFLIFVMLAAERKPEMGMARAVGAQRQHLVEMFVYEGAAYDLAAAAVGAALGVALAMGLGDLLSEMGTEAIGFELRPYITPRSLGVAYSLGLLVTFATVLASAARVSRLNIVAAIRDLPEPPSPPATMRRLFAPLAAAAQAGRALWHRQVRRALSGCLLGVPASLMSLLAGGFAAGPLTLLAGLALLAPGRAGAGAARIGLGLSLTIVGGGQLLRGGLRRAFRRRPALADRLACTLLGAGLLGLWALPPELLEGPRLGRSLVLGPEVFFLSGLGLVVGSVLVLVYNGDLLLWAVLRLLGNSRRLAPVLRMAVAYPLTSRFRTGLTLGIFAVVVFSVIFIASAFEASAAGLRNVEQQTGGWDLRLTTSPSNPIRDLREAIAAEPQLRAADYAVIGSRSEVALEARQGAGTWYPHYVVGVNRDFLQHARIDLRLMAEGFTTPQAVWRRLQERPDYALIDRYSLATRRGAPSDLGQRFELTGVYLDDPSMVPARVELRERGSGATFHVTVIGVYEPSAVLSGGLLVSQATLAEALPEPPLPWRHFVRLAPGVDRPAAAQALEGAFLAHGLEGVDLWEEQQAGQRSARALITLLRFFLTLGLVVGVAALGVISTRAVVERRQQIGMLRALGFRRGMVAASFVLEASFVALLGISLGAGLALIPAYHLVRESAGEGLALPFLVPWGTMGLVLALAWGMTLVTTALPALQAARVPPAEALRYE